MFNWLFGKSKGREPRDSGLAKTVVQISGSGRSPKERRLAGWPQVRTHVEANAPSLQPTDIDDSDELAWAASGGREISAYLVERFRQAGLTHTGIEPWEDYGHHFQVQFEGRKMWILAQGDCMLGVEDKTGPALRHEEDSPLARFVTLIHEILSADDRFSKIGWWRDSDPPHAPSDHPLGEFGTEAPLER